MKRFIVVGLALVVTAIVASGCALGQASDATDVTRNKATLNGSVRSASGDGQTEYWWQFGRTTTYELSWAVSGVNVIDTSDHAPHAVSVSTNVHAYLLTPGVTYHFRLCAKDDDQGQANCGGDRSFTTPAS